ncbi:MFS transporter [Ignatzschineria rhizosphaerae]|uniref:MFS transporter n=1 Tax=Ignatzschineria rhizosphaerae TaxID=2923279 RepID=A0ABY3X0K5_9GAMM|nr:MFS transporter [Ignatzschineria rhizosphaerae]UNM96418.1 MFS transporter [Ignatzschineria rhizosphaerae]
MKNINANQVIDNAKMTPYHYFIITVCALIIIFDGYDLVIYGATLSEIMKEWQIRTVTAGFLGSLPLFGMMFGAIIFGSLTDKFEHLGASRKRIISICIIIFSLFTVFAGFAKGPMDFGIYRVIAGLGLGGVMPNVIALVTEYAPKRLRSTLVSVMFSGYAIGGMMAALLGIVLVPAFGWNIMYLLAGVPIVLLLPMMIYLPEPIEYLIRNNREEEAKKVLKKIDSTITLNAQTQLILNNDNQQNSAAPIKAIFQNGLGLGTLLFWITFFMSLLLVYALGNWIPKLMLEQGFNLSTSLAFLFSLNIGAMFGAIFGGMLADKYTPRKVLALFYFVGAVALFLLSFKSHIVLIYLLVAIAGATSIGAQIIVCAFVAQYYPTSIRATGIGWGLGVGRLGAIAGPMIIGWILSLNLPIQYNFLALAIPSLIALVSVFLIKGDQQEESIIHNEEALLEAP